MHVFPIILAGGSGTRLWPLSRKDFPKQFLNLYGETSLLQQTVERAKNMPHTGMVVEIPLIMLSWKKLNVRLLC